MLGHPVLQQPAVSVVLWNVREVFCRDLIGELAKLTDEDTTQRTEERKEELRAGT